MWSYVLIVACWIYVVSCKSFFPRNYGYGGSYNFQQSTPCKVSNWSIWGQTDYYGIQRRYRRITEYPTKGGYPCPTLTETRTGKNGEQGHALVFLVVLKASVYMYYCLNRILFI